MVGIVVLRILSRSAAVIPGAIWSVPEVSSPVSSSVLYCVAGVSLFCEALIARERARGVILLGVSGSGKSAFCKRLGCSTHRPTLILDIGALMGSLVGQTEAALRKALKQIDAMSPCIVMIDEIEKCLSTSSNDGIFFVDLPDHTAKQKIWAIYEHEYEIAKQKHPSDTDWTGAEIKACCRLSKLLDTTLIEAAKNTVPVS